METLAEEFVAWTMASDRSLDEAFLAEILIEEGLSRWKARENIADPGRYDWQAKREHHRRGRLNPAHRRIWSEIDVKHAAEFVIHFSKFEHWTHGEDRPVRDLTALRFCPQMKDLHLAPAELSSLDGLGHVPLLEHLWLQDAILEDLAPLRRCPRVKNAAPLAAIPMVRSAHAGRAAGAGTTHLARKSGGARRRRPAAQGQESAF